MNKGDTLNIILNYTIDGEPIAENEFDEIEFSFGNRQYTLTKNEIIWDMEKGKYTVFITQNDTFALPDTVNYQLRVRKGNKVASTPIGTTTIGQSLSKKNI